ncbi:MAG: hypothetical protein NXH95_13520 [Pseudomonadaceae bacterium]|nr:hypothetical protein [Pseudomonadaceae bacterium]
MTATRKIYLASSWRNERQPEVVEMLKFNGFEVYDFKNPAPGNNGFHWSAINPDWKNWNAGQFIAALWHPYAKKGFFFDKQALDWCDTCIMLMPCGVSASLELGYCAGAGKRTAVYIPELREPELMFMLADFITDDAVELLEWCHAGGAPGR